MKEEGYKQKKVISKERVTSYYERNRNRSLKEYYPQDFYYIVNGGFYGSMTEVFRESLEIIIRRNIEIIDQEHLYRDNLGDIDVGLRGKGIVVEDVALDGRGWTSIKEECFRMELHKFTKEGITGLIRLMIEDLEKSRMEWLDKDSPWREGIEHWDIKETIDNNGYYKEDYVYRYERYLITLYRFLGEGIQPVLRDKVRDVREQLTTLRGKRQEYEGKEEEYSVYKSMLKWEIEVYETFNEWSKKVHIYEDRHKIAYLKDVNVKINA